MKTAERITPKSDKFYQNTLAKYKNDESGFATLGALIFILVVSIATSLWLPSMIGQRKTTSDSQDRLVSTLNMEGGLSTALTMIQYEPCSTTTMDSSSDDVSLTLTS